MQQLGAAEPSALADEIEHLTAYHAVRTRRMRKGSQCIKRRICPDMGVFRSYRKCLCLHAVSGEHRGSLSVADMVCRRAASDRIAVEARHIVMDKRIGVQRLNSTCKRNSRLFIADVCPAECERKKRAYPFSASKQAVTHSLIQLGGAAAGTGIILSERTVDPLARLVYKRRNIVRTHRLVLVHNAAALLFISKLSR